MTTLKPQVAIAGAGLAGMSLALDLARAGHPVVLLERRRRAGGAVQTLDDARADNSVHLFLSAFTRCLSRLEWLGSRQELRELEPSCRVAWQDKLLVLPLGASRPRALLDLARLGRPGWKLVAGLWRLLECQVGEGECAAVLSTRAGLRPGSLVETFWREWALSVFNAPLDELDAVLALRTLRSVLEDPRHHRPLVAAQSLEALWILPFERALERAGARLLTGCALRAVERRGGRVTAFLADGLRIEARHFIWAGSPDGMKELDGLSDLTPPLPARRLGRHIVNLLLPVEGDLDTGGLRGWFGAPFQWVFPAGPGRAALVGSGWTDQDLERREGALAQVPELLERHGVRLAGPPRWIVQRHATHLQTPAFEAARPGPGTQAENLSLCGAWLRTGLPLSMESALAGAEMTLGNLQFE